MFNITKDIPGDHTYPAFGPNGEIYFISGHNPEIGVTERAIHVIRDINNPESSLEALLIENSTDSNFATIDKPEVSLDETKLIFQKFIYQNETESGIFAINLTGGEPYPLALGFGSMGAMTQVPGTNEMLVGIYGGDTASGLKKTNISTGATEDYLFSFNSDEDVSFNEARFTTIAATMGGEIFAFARKPGTILGFSYLYSWNYDDPSSLTMKFGPKTVPVVPGHRTWWNDLRNIGNVEGDGEYMLMVHYRNMFSDNKNSIGISKVSDIGSVVDWSPTYVRVVASASRADKRHPAWTPFSIDEL